MQKVSIIDPMFFNQDYINPFFGDKSDKINIDLESFNEFLLEIEQSKKISNEKNEKTPNDFGFQKLCFLLKRGETEESEKEGESEKKEEGEIEKKVSSENNEAVSSIDSIISQIKNAGTKNESVRNDYVKNDNLIAPEFNEYEKHSQVYREFMNSILYDNTYASEEEKNQNYSQYGEEKEFRQGDEVMNFNERKEYVKKVMTNAKFGENSLNHVDEGEKKKYELWKAVNSLNLYLSFLMYDNPCLYQ